MTTDDPEVNVAGAPALVPELNDVAAPGAPVLVLELDVDDAPGPSVPELVIDAPVALEVEPDDAEAASAAVGAFLASFGGGAPTAPPDAGRFAPKTAFSPAQITNGRGSVNRVRTQPSRGETLLRLPPHPPPPPSRAVPPNPGCEERTPKPPKGRE